MYTLDDIYNVATNELGMVYAKKGQIIYYDSANEDYVKQYQDVPGSNQDVDQKSSSFAARFLRLR